MVLLQSLIFSFSYQSKGNTALKDHPILTRKLTSPAKATPLLHGLLETLNVRWAGQSLAYIEMPPGVFHNMGKTQLIKVLFEEAAG